MEAEVQKEVEKSKESPKVEAVEAETAYEASSLPPYILIGTFNESNTDYSKILKQK